MRKNRIYPGWKNCPTWLCSIPFDNVICSTQVSERNKAEALFSAPILFLECRRDDFHVPFLCIKIFHVELPVPCILKVLWLSGYFTVFKQKIHLKVNNHTLGRPEDNKWPVFLQKETHLGLRVLQPFKHFCKSECLKKAKYIRKNQKLWEKNPLAFGNKVYWLCMCGLSI